MTRFHTHTDPLKRLKRDKQTGEWLLPDLNVTGNVARAWQAFTLLEATDWKYPRDIDQDAELLHDVMEIKAASVLVKRMLEEKNKPPAKSKPRQKRG